MDGRRYAPWVLALSLVSCGPDGGTSGTGISGGPSGTGTVADRVETVVEGVVRDVQQARRGTEASWLVAARRLVSISPPAVAAGGVEGLEVRLEGTRLRTVTDPDGKFVLQGDFGDGVTLVFGDGSGREARLDLTVPAGGHLQSDDIVVDFTSGDARSAGQQVRFDAIVRTTDCLANRVTVTSRFEPNGPEYTVHTDGASLEDSAGEPVRCRELRPGDPIAVSGPIDADGTVGASREAAGRAVSDFGL